MEFYKILQSIMKERNLSVAQVSKVTGLSDSTVRSILSRKQKSVALEVTSKISKGLGVSYERLNGEVTDDNYNTSKIYEYSISDLSITEKANIKKYRVLDEHGKRMVDYVLNEEFERCTENISEVNEQEVKEIKLYDLPVSAGTGNY